MTRILRHDTAGDQAFCEAKHQVKVILEGLGARAIRFHKEHKLGVYKKAKLGNVFKWKLRDLGFSEDFAERALEYRMRIGVDQFPDSGEAYLRALIQLAKDTAGA